MAKKSQTFAELIINLAANSAAYNRELQKANRKTKDWAKETREHVNAAGKYFIGMGTAAGVSFAAIYKSAASANDALAKHADKIGISTEALSGLRHQADLNGVSQEKLDLGLQRMVRRVAEAAQGTGEAKNAIKELGLEADALAAMSPDQQFKAIADQMQNVGSQSDKVRLGFKLFDSEGVGLINAMRGGADEISRAQKEAEKLGITVNRIDAAKIEAANDAVAKSQGVFKGAANSIAIEFAPLVQAAADMFKDAALSSNGFRDEAINGVESVVLAISYAGDTVKGLEVAFKTTQVAVSMSINGWLEGFNLLQSGIAEVYNYFSDDKIDVSNNALSKMVQSSRKDTEALKLELHELSTEPLPSDKIKIFFDDVRANAQKAAEAVAENAEKMRSSASIGMTIKQDSKTIEAIYEVEKYTMSSYERQYLAATESYAKHQNLLYEAKNKENWTQVEFEEKSTQLTKIYAEQRAQIEQQQRQIHINGSKQFFADLATLTDHGHKTVAQIGKWAARINITISTIEAAQKAYNWGMGFGGPYAAGAAASAAVIAGAMRLRQLEQATSGGGVGGGGSGLSGATTFDQSLPTAQNTALSPTEDSAARGGQVVIQQSIEIKALDGASVQQVVQDNREIFLQPVYEEIEERGGLG